MRVLVAWGSKSGGTEGIARAIGEELTGGGIEATLRPASAVDDLGGYDAAIIGGALYANRWHRDAARLVRRNVEALRQIPAWLFSSGPLDDSADRSEIPPVRQVAVLAERVGALGHATFGGRLADDAKGFPAEAMAKKLAGDWRNSDRAKTWAAGIAEALPHARPGTAIEPPGGSIWRLVAHGIVGWALCAALMAGLMQIAPTGIAIAFHAIAAPVIFVLISFYYFSARGAREPLPTAIAFTAIVALLDLGVVAALVLQSLDMFRSFAGTWLPFGLIFVATWATGAAMAMIPERAAARPAGPSAGNRAG